MANTTTVTKNNQVEVDQVLDLVKNMDVEEKRKLIVFLQGARFAKELGSRAEIKR